MSEAGYWAVMTAPLLECTEISDGAKLFYAQLSRFSNGSGLCWASNPTLSEKLGVSERTITRYVTELENAGFIATELVGVNGKKKRAERHIRLAQPAPFKVDKNVYLKVDKNVEDKVDKNVYPYKESNKTESNPPKSPPGGGRVLSMPKWKPERFEKFWEFYRQNVRGEKREAAVKAWDKLKPDDALIEEIGRALLRQIASDEWRRGIGVPYCSSYLNGKRWLDTPRHSPALPARAPVVTEEDEIIV